jgi:hypothetical protein
MDQDIVNAIKGKNYLKFNYEGYERIVEPHTYGVSTKGNELLRAYQTEGGSNSGNVPGWKLFKYLEMNLLETLDNTFHNPRPGYKKGDSVMQTIYEEL